MGAEIEGIGTERLVVHGKPALHGARHRVLPDRIELGTYAMAAAITGGDLELIGGDVELLPEVLPVLAEAGIAAEDRSEERRGGKEWERSWRSRWAGIQNATI